MAGHIPAGWASVQDWMRIVANAVNPLLAGIKNGVTKTAAHTVAEDDDVVLCDATGGAFTVTLPKAGLFTGKQVIIKKIDASANAVTIDGNGAETIDGAATVAMSTQYESRTLFAGSTGWHII
jgi:hypothetical protein